MLQKVRWSFCRAVVNFEHKTFICFSFLLRLSVCFDFLSNLFVQSVIQRFLFWIFFFCAFLALLPAVHSFLLCFPSIVRYYTTCYLKNAIRDRKSEDVMQPRSVSFYSFFLLPSILNLCCDLLLHSIIACLVLSTVDCTRCHSCKLALPSRYGKCLINQWKKKGKKMTEQVSVAV